MADGDRALLAAAGGSGAAAGVSAAAGARAKVVFRWYLMVAADSVAADTLTLRDGLVKRWVGACLGCAAGWRAVLGAGAGVGASG